MYSYSTTDGRLKGCRVSPATTAQRGVVGYFYGFWVPYNYSYIPTRFVLKRRIDLISFV